MSDKKTESCRLNKVGGQAVLEGVMMKAGDRTVTTCRKEDGTLVVKDGIFHSVRKKHKWLNIPILRGCVNFVEMMILSVKTLNFSAEAMGIEDEKEKARKEKAKAEGKKAVGTLDVVMILSVLLGLGLAIVLFIMLPTLAAGGIDSLYKLITSSEQGLGEIPLAIIDGIMKIIIFLVYLFLVSLMPDIRRTFQYHGAEHKSIACFEAGDELTPENAKKHKRFHPRCGTSFMFLMILIGIFAGIFVRFILPDKTSFPSDVLYSLTVGGLKLLLLPLTMGIGYEILMFAGKHPNIFTKIISAPGLWVQRLTTKEPDESQLEVAIVSIKCALRDEFPEFTEFWNERGWEKKTDGESTDDGGERQNDGADLCAGSEEEDCHTSAEDSTDSAVNGSDSTEADADSAVNGSDSTEAEDGKEA